MQIRHDNIFKALADPTRRKIIHILGRGEMSAGELAKQFDISSPSMSHHFAVLKQADLVETRRAGQQIYYALNATVFQEVLSQLMDLFSVGEARTEFTDDSQTVLRPYGS